MSFREPGEVRPATPGDLDALCILYKAFHEFNFRCVPYRLRSLEGAGQDHRRKLRAGLRDIIGRNDAALLVAVIGDEMVGMVEVYVRGDEPDVATFARVYGYLQSLMVLEPFRGLGAGKQLLTVAQDWVRENGATEMRLDVWEFEDGPLSFYELCGYSTLKRTLVREIGEQP